MVKENKTCPAEELETQKPVLLHIFNFPLFPPQILYFNQFQACFWQTCSISHWLRVKRYKLNILNAKKKFENIFQMLTFAIIV